MQLTGFAGVTFASLNMQGGWLQDSIPGPDMQTQDLARRGYTPVHVGTQRGPLTIQTMFKVNQADLETTMAQFMSVINPDDDSERVLSALRHDGTPVQCYAALVAYTLTAPEVLELTFSASDGHWRKPAATNLGTVTWPYNAATVLATPNTGKITSPLSVTMKPTAYDPGTVGFKFRRQFSVTNNSDTPLRQFPYEVDLGDSNGWGNTVTANASKTWIFRDGLQVPRELIGWSEIQSYAWILIDDLGPGATATYDIAWEGLTDATGFTGNRRPGFDITWEKNNATAGGASTITKSSASWRTDQWARGKIHILSGTGAGQNRYILSNTATVITTVNTWTTNPDATSVFLLRMSHNERWIYDVRETSRSNSNRGLWYQNRGQSKPSLITFDTPGSWYRALQFDNNDEKNQSRTFGVDVGGGDVDYFNGLDADRTAQGWTRLQESGQADGIAFSSPIEIDGFRFDVAFKNPNGMCKATVGYRESGAEDWEEAWSDSGAYSTLTASGISDTTFSADIRHLAAYLGPADDTQIPLDWIKDNGSATAGTSTTLTDATKSWVTNQFAGGRIRIVAGARAGQSRTISSNTASVITVSPAWSNGSPGDDSRYEIKNPRLVSTLRHNTQWEVRLNTSKITQSAIGAQLTNYRLNHTFTLGGGPDAAVPYQRVTLGANSRYLHVASTEELRIDGARRRAGIYITSSGAFARDATNAVTVQSIEANSSGATQTLYATDWLPIPPTPTNPLVNPDFTANINNWTQSSVTGGVTQARSWDGTQGHLILGSFKVDITASTAASGATISNLSGVVYSEIAVIPGKAYTVTAWGRTSGRNWIPKLGITWYNAGGTSLGTFIAGSEAINFVPAVGTWYQIGTTAIAPATAAYGRLALIAYERVSSTIDTVWFDEARWDTTAISLLTQTTGVTVDVSGSLTEGYHG